MSQVSKHLLEKEVYQEIIDTLFQVVANLSTKADVADFLNEFLSPNEKIMFAKRLAVGILIAQNFDYADIKNLLKVSNSTVSTYSLCYKYGKSYREIVDKIKSSKQIKELVIDIAEGASTMGSWGGKGSGGWRELGKKLKRKKSKLLR